MLRGYYHLFVKLNLIQLEVKQRKARVYVPSDPAC